MTNVPHEPALYAGARAAVAKIIRHPCDSVNTGLYALFGPAVLSCGQAEHGVVTQFVRLMNCPESVMPTATPGRKLDGEGDGRAQSPKRRDDESPPRRVRLASGI